MCANLHTCDLLHCVKLAPDMNAATGTEFSAYVTFARNEWASLRLNTPMTLSSGDLSLLQGVLEQVSLEDVVKIYLPLSRLLNLHFRSARTLSGVCDEFLGKPVGRAPYVIGIAGSVAVGKSTFARTLQAVLARWPDHPSVALVTTDGFLYPNATLLDRQLMSRKGFPESYDRRRMISFLADIKAGKSEVVAPVYSHQGYDIVPGEAQTIASPDILIFEGLNVLQTATLEGGRAPSIIVSDFFDFSLYIDAEEADIQEWYVARFIKLQRTVFQNPTSYFHHYKDLDADQTREVALDIWRDINLRNLNENILPSRERANVVLRKRADHLIGEVWLRQI
jgi:type I pantothenate kinase